MINPKISVIIPIYKAELYLCRCVDSILSQSFTDFELLLIDDGSPDKCAQICDDYMSLDSRVVVYHKENGGVSSARNLGLENSKGEFVIFVDPDDWVDSEMLYELYQNAQTSYADMIICDYYMQNGDLLQYKSQMPSSLDNQQLLCDLFTYLHGFCWNKLVKRECFIKHNIRFPQSISYCEDLYVIAALIKKGIKVSYVDRAFYHYIKNENSNSLSKPINGSFEMDAKMFNLFCDLLKGYRAENVFKHIFSSRIILRNFWRGEDSNCNFHKHCYPYLKYIYPWDDIKASLIIYPSSLGLYSVVKFLYNIKHNV